MYHGPNPDCILPRATKPGRMGVGKMREVQGIQGGGKEISQNLFIQQKLLISGKAGILHSGFLFT